MGRLIKYLFRIAILAAIGLAGYALVADLPPPRKTVTTEIPIQAPAE